MSRTQCIAGLVLAALFGSPLRAQDHAHPQGAGGRLGAVHFPTSCAPAVAPTFDRAVAWLHSFEFSRSIATFEEVLATDSTCAMAWWGIGISRWTNPMVPNIRPPALLARGKQAIDVATRLGSGASARERLYIAAAAELFGDPAREQPARVAAYERAMADLAERFPDDSEAKIFHAIALVGAAQPGDKSYANQLKAGAALEALFAVMPDHPGLAHYIIHAYDVPALAARAAAAARRYADIAPDAAHALHMPSHAFTRVGLWNESVATNMRSMEWAIGSGSIAEALHAADYAVYANLQMRRDSAARALLARLPELAARFDPQAVTGAAPGSAGVYALAAMPARYALERNAWTEAVELQPGTSAFPYAEALTHFARALGGAHTGNMAVTRSAADSLAAIRDRLMAAREAYWAEQVAIQHLGAAAWLAFGGGQHDDALRLMKEAAAREDATEKAAVTPGPLAPARELLGDMLAALNRPAEALMEYKATLQREPNRYHTVKGAMDAAGAAGDAQAKAGYAAQLALLTGPAPRR